MSDSRRPPNLVVSCSDGSTEQKKFFFLARPLTFEALKREIIQEYGPIRSQYDIFWIDDENEESIINGTNGGINEAIEYYLRKPTAPSHPVTLPIRLKVYYEERLSSSDASSQPGGDRSISLPDYRNPNFTRSFVTTRKDTRDVTDVSTTRSSVDGTSRIPGKRPDGVARFTAASRSQAADYQLNQSHKHSRALPTSYVARQDVALASAALERLGLQASQPLSPDDIYTRPLSRTSSSDPAMKADVSNFQLDTSTNLSTSLSSPGYPADSISTASRRSESDQHSPPHSPDAESIETRVLKTRDTTDCSKCGLLLESTRHVCNTCGEKRISSTNGQSPTNTSSSSSTHIEGYQLCSECVQSYGVHHSISIIRSEDPARVSLMNADELSSWIRSGPRYKGHVRHAYITQQRGLNGWEDVGAQQVTQT
ncbi:hypothetical protein EW146_g7331 [Bondarzewia mesenterica]|uniref:PB1 domain-containing protein n=1 Tax=Bondarzewia mesenterica TaxID=1095465 RepID=A0A4S4LMW3_9AGAM|nr:hypothetical protein EW146_g7331 [Bondarzewia mesenterica]